MNNTYICLKDHGNAKVDQLWTRLTINNKEYLTIGNTFIPLEGNFSPYLDEYFINEKIKIFNDEIQEIINES